MKTLAILALTPGTTALIIIALAVIILYILTCIKIIPQGSAAVLQRFGRYYKTWETGIHFKMPFIDKIEKRVILKELPAPARYYKR